jgi:hypothetical protein
MAPKSINAWLKSKMACGGPRDRPQPLLRGVAVGRAAAGEEAKQDAGDVGVEDRGASRGEAPHRASRISPNPWASAARIVLGGEPP